jgi:hypothetical protein
MASSSDPLIMKWKLCVKDTHLFGSESGLGARAQD